MMNGADNDIALKQREGRVRADGNVVVRLSNKHNLSHAWVPKSCTHSLSPSFLPLPLFLWFSLPNPPPLSLYIYHSPTYSRTHTDICQGFLWGKLYEQVKTRAQNAESALERVSPEKAKWKHPSTHGGSPTQSSALQDLKTVLDRQPENASQVLESPSLESIKNDKPKSLSTT